MIGYVWNDDAIYNEDVDSMQYGSCSGLPRRSIIAGSYIQGNLCGSRCIAGRQCSAFNDAGNATARGCNGNCIILGHHGME